MKQLEVVGRIQTEDFCRHCKGKGYMTAAPGELIPRCRYCEGTGLQTVLIYEKPTISEEVDGHETF